MLQISAGESTQPAQPAAVILNQTVVARHPYPLRIYAVMPTVEESPVDALLVTDTAYAKTTKELIEFVTTLRSLGYVVRLAPNSDVLRGQHANASPNPQRSCIL